MTRNAPLARPGQSAPAAQPWTVLAAVEGTAARVELRRYDLPSPNEMWEIDEAPILSVVLPRTEGTHGEIMFDIGNRERHAVGRLMLRPAGIAMHSRGNGGVLDILVCRFDPQRFAATTGLDQWSARQLSRCAAIVSPAIQALAERLRHETVSPALGSATAINALVDLLMVELGRMLGRTPDEEGAQGRLAPWQLARIEQRLRTGEGDWPTTQELAELCGISRSHLSRSFAATTGLSLSDHAAAIRLERAQDLIAEGVLPLKAIAGMLGFATASAFSAAFRRGTGQAPGAYRRSLR